MAAFPSLSSGVVTQYPTGISTGQGVGVIRFIDGSDQRFLNQGRMLRQWQIRLSLLSEDEVHKLESFFAGQQGDYSTFDFPDPISATNVPNCRFASPELTTEYLAADVSSASLWVMETNG